MSYVRTEGKNGKIFYYKVDGNGKKKRVGAADVPASVRGDDPMPKNAKKSCKQIGKAAEERCEARRAKPKAKASPKKASPKRKPKAKASPKRKAAPKAKGKFYLAAVSGYEKRIERSDRAKIKQLELRYSTKESQDAKLVYVVGDKTKTAAKFAEFKGPNYDVGDGVIWELKGKLSKKAMISAMEKATYELNKLDYAHFFPPGEDQEPDYAIKKHGADTYYFVKIDAESG